MTQSTEIETPAYLEEGTKSDHDFKSFLEKIQLPIEEEKASDNYAVILHNDPVTPAQLVVLILCHVFSLPQQRAMDITWAVHRTGQAVVAVTTESAADQKIAQALEAARGYPLRFSKEKQ